MKWGRKNGIWLLIAVLAGFLLFFKLNTLTAGLSHNEYDLMTRGLGAHGLINDVLYFPIRLLRTLVVLLAGTDHVFIDRTVNVIFGLIGIVLFAYIVRSWHDLRTTILTTLLFVCSPLLLHVSRLVGNDVMQLLVIPLILTGNVLLRKFPESKVIFYLVVISWAFIITIPGGIWFVLLNIWLKRDDVVESIKDLTNIADRTILLLVLLVMLSPLAWFIFGKSSVIAWLGLPTNFDNLSESIKTFALTPYYIFVQPVKAPEIWLERAPLLSVFNLTMFLFGTYYYLKRWSAGRSRQLTAFLLLAVFLIAVDGNVGLAILLPLLYIIIAAGIAYISKIWFKTFPINPLARTTGNILIIAAVAISCIYGLRSYFIAWPHNPNTKAIFKIKV